MDLSAPRYIHRHMIVVKSYKWKCFCCTIDITSVFRNYDACLQYKLFQGHDSRSVAELTELSVNVAYTKRLSSTKRI
jgi:uncharacterized protein YfcZ (UPF0381/DUF406 family)